MGARHQIFIIARLRPQGDPSTPPKYRCVAALHDQSCSGEQPLRRAQRFITLAKQKNNAELIAAEIAGMQGVYGRWQQHPTMPRIPAPCISFLLTSSWFVDPNNGDQMVASGCSFAFDSLNADMGTADGDNNYGITVIDVTDPSSPAYCFNAIRGPPLSALQYLSGYYHEIGTLDELKDPDPTGYSERLSLLSFFKNVPIVTVEMLHEAWPAEYEDALAHSVKKSAAEGHERSRHDALVPARSPAAFPSMQGMALVAALDYALDTGETAGLKDWLWRPDMLAEICAMLRARNPFPDTGIPLLAAVLDIDTTPGLMDLRGLALSSGQVMQLVSARDKLEVLNLSDNAVVTVDVVPRVLSAHPDLQRLVLLGCPSIPDTALYSIFASHPSHFYRVGAVIHPALFSADPDAAPYPSAFSFIAYTGEMLNHMFSRPYFTPPSIVQALTLFLDGFCELETPILFIHSAHVSQSLLSAAPLRSGQPWRERDVALMPRYSPKVLEGEGWAFCFRCSDYHSDTNAYGFVRFLGPAASSGTAQETRKGGGAGDVAGAEATDAAGAISGPAPTFAEILDLRAFLSRMAAEGRPVPHEDDVKALERCLTALEEHKFRFRLFEEPELARFVGERAWDDPKQRRGQYWPFS